MKVLGCFAVVLSLLVFVEQADAGSNGKAMWARTLGICKPKIDAKHLKGDVKKAAWASCKADPDNYN